jgi:predicted DNA-binding WGR domain protein
MVERFSTKTEARKFARELLAKKRKKGYRKAGGSAPQPMFVIEDW